MLLLQVASVQSGLNKSKPPDFFINTLLCDDVHDWQVMSFDTVSDYRQIRFVIKQDRSAPTKRRNVRRTDWDVYSAELCARIGMWFGRVDTPEDMERELDVVNIAILHSFCKASPERRISGRNKMPWWNHDQPRSYVQWENRAFHRAFKSGIEQDWQSHREAHWAFKQGWKYREIFENIGYF